VEQLKVGIGADTKGLEKGLKDAEKALSTFATRSKQIEAQLKNNAIESSKLGAEISKLELDYKKGTISQSDFGKGMLKLTNAEKTLSNESKVLRNDLAKLNASSRDLGTGGMGTLKKGTANGASAMTAFSRTVQDAPFGLMGVSNNITNLTEQFGYLKKSTGSTGGALKAMLRDLKGFGGITLGISLITSAMLIFGDTLFKTKDKAKQLKEEQEKLTESLENYVDGLESVDKAMIKGSQSSQKEVISLRLLKEQAEDTTLSMEDRIRAVDELQRVYPSYLGNVSKEKILNGEVSKTFETLTANILKRAKATAALNMIVKNSEELLILERQAAEKKAEITKKAIQLENANALAQLRAGKERGGSNFSVQRAIQLQGEYNKLIKEGAKLEGKIQGIELDNLDLEKAVNDLGGAIPIKLTPKIEVEQPRKELESLYNGLTEANIVGREAFNLSSIETPLQVLPPDFDEQAEMFKIRLAEFNQAVSQIMQQGKFDTISGFAEAIGGALASGGNVLEAAGNALLSSLGGIMVHYGKLILAFGLASEALKTAMQNPFGGGIAAIVAGIALIAIGSAISSFASSTASSGGSGGSSSSSGGGGSYSAPNIGSGYSAPSSSGGYSGSSNGGTVVFEIAGQKLVGVLSNTLARNKNLGGTLTIT